MSSEHIFEQVKIVSAAVLSGEACIDQSMSSTCRMIAEALDAGRRVGMPAYAVQPALDHMSEALFGQLESRRQIALAHVEFGRTAEKLGATAEDYGDLWPCPSYPKPSGTSTPSRRLKAVAQ